MTCATKNCEQQLCELREAYQKVIQGGVQEVVFGDESTKYFQGNIKELKSEIRRLENECGDSAVSSRPARGFVTFSYRR